MIIATISTLSYLNRAKVMAKSVKEHHPDAIVILCLAERSLTEDIGSHCFDQVLLPKDLAIANLEKTIFKYNHHEASIYLKGELLNYLYRTYVNEEKIIYMDADIKVYSPLVEMLDALQEHSIVFTPHMFKPHPDYYTAYLWYGFINAGFVGFRRSGNAKRFIEWWASKLEKYCYVDRERFIQLSQAWAKLAPTFFKDLLRHPGYNVAFWNLHERNIQISNNQFFVNKTPLRFFHYSSLNGALKDYVNKTANGDVRSLYEQYMKELDKVTIPHLASKSWSYGYFQNGTRIENKTREIYRKNDELQRKYPYPFRFSHSFFEDALLKISSKNQETAKKTNSRQKIRKKGKS